MGGEGPCSALALGAQVEVATSQAPPTPGAAAAAATDLTLQPLAPLAPLPSGLGGVTLVTQSTVPPPPPLSSLPQLFADDSTSLMELTRWAGSAEAGLLELFHALQRTRQEGNHTFNELGKYLVQVEAVQEEKLQMLDQHVAGGISQINTVLNSHHTRHHQVEERLAHIQLVTTQLLADQHSTSIQMAQTVRMELKHFIDHFGSQVSQLEERLNRHIAA